MTDLPTLITHAHLVLAAIVLQVLDAASTLYFLRHTRLTEANPVLARLFAAFGPAPTLLVLKGAFAWGLWLYQALLPVWALALVCALYVAVVANNVRLIRRAKQQGGAHGA
jgi:hypothetical protein